MEDLIKTLTWRSFAASRVRNLIAVLAVAPTAVFFTSVTIFGMGTSESDVLDDVQADLTFCSPTHGHFPAQADQLYFPKL